MRCVRAQTPAQLLAPRRASLSKRKFERGTARLSALYPALYPRWPADEAPPDEADEAGGVATLSSPGLGFPQQRVEPAGARRPAPSTPARLGADDTEPAALTAGFAPLHTHVAAQRRNSSAPLPSLELSDDGESTERSSSEGEVRPHEPFAGSQRLHAQRAALF